MGSAAQSCYCQKTFLANQYEIPTIEKQKEEDLHPTKQNFLIYPNLVYEKYNESLEELEVLLHQSNMNLSLNQTATFQSNQYSDQHNTNYLVKTLKQQFDGSINTRNKDNFDCLSVEYELRNHNTIQQKNAVSFKKKKILSRSLSTFKPQKCQPTFRMEIMQKEVEKSTIKSILKKKPNQNNGTQSLRRGQSLKCFANYFDTNDEHSQKTSYSKIKRVQFDPKIFRYKNQNFFY